MKFVEEPGGMSAVHLNVVELEGDGQSCLQPAFAVAAPHHHRITELVGVLVDDAVEFGGRHRRRAYHHRTVWITGTVLMIHFLSVYLQISF